MGNTIFQAAVVDTARKKEKKIEKNRGSEGIQCMVHPSKVRASRHSLLFTAERPRFLCPDFVPHAPPPPPRQPSVFYQRSGPSTFDHFSFKSAIINNRIVCSDCHVIYSLPAHRLSPRPPLTRIYSIVHA